MGMPIGKQDQYASAFGGLNKITFTGEGVTVEPVKIDPRSQDIRERLWLLYRQFAPITSILKHQRQSTQDRDEAGPGLTQYQAGSDRRTVLPRTRRPG
jgi:D-glycero-alpha-D-manno-heptose-7-phosphate kinase